jgi:hypothetical protein
VLLPRLSRVRNPTRIFTSGLSMLQQTHTLMTFDTPMNFWLCRFRGSMDFYFSLTQKHRNVEEADLTTSVTPRGFG